jgi:uncharacterized membrane protein YfcA
MNAQQVWQAQATEAPRISLAYVRHRASSLERRTRLRNSLEYVVCVIVCGFCGFVAWQKVSGRPLMVASLVCLALWSLYYMYRWHGFAAAEASPADAGVLDTLRYQRRQLERQRDMRRRSWRWWGPTILPCFALMLASLIIEQDSVPWNAIGVLAAGFFVGTAVAVGLLEYEARRFQREIEALDSLAEGQ